MATDADRITQLFGAPLNEDAAQEILRRSEQKKYFYITELFELYSTLVLGNFTETSEKLKVFIRLFVFLTSDFCTEKKEELRKIFVESLPRISPREPVLMSAYLDLFNVIDLINKEYGYTIDSRFFSTIILMIFGYFDVDTVEKFDDPGRTVKEFIIEHRERLIGAGLCISLIEVFSVLSPTYESDFDSLIYPDINKFLRKSLSTLSTRDKQEIMRFVRDFQNGRELFEGINPSDIFRYFANGEKGLLFLLNHNILTLTSQIEDPSSGQPISVLGYLVNYCPGLLTKDECAIEITNVDDMSISELMRLFDISPESFLVILKEMFFFPKSTILPKIYVYLFYKCIKSDSYASIAARAPQDVTIFTIIFRLGKSHKHAIDSQAFLNCFFSIINQEPDEFRAKALELVHEFGCAFKMAFDDSSAPFHELLKVRVINEIIERDQYILWGLYRKISFSISSDTLVIQQDVIFNKIDEQILALKQELNKNGIEIGYPMIVLQLKLCTGSHTYRSQQSHPIAEAFTCSFDQITTEESGIPPKKEGIAVIMDNLIVLLVLLAFESSPPNTINPDSPALPAKMLTCLDEFSTWRKQKLSQPRHPILLSQVSPPPAPAPAPATVHLSI